MRKSNIKHQTSAWCKWKGLSIFVSLRIKTIIVVWGNIYRPSEENISSAKTQLFIIALYPILQRLSNTNTINVCEFNIDLLQVNQTPIYMYLDYINTLLSNCFLSVKPARFSERICTLNFIMLIVQASNNIHIQLKQSAEAINKFINEKNLRIF